MTSLFKHQQEAIRWIKDRKRSFLHADIGTGKSLIAIELFKMFSSMNPILITKKSTFTSWDVELKKFAPDLKLTMLSTESFSRNGKHKDAGANDIVVMDESSLVKNHKSKRSKNIYKFCRGGGKVLLMSGSALTKSPLDIFSQAKVLGFMYKDCNTYNKFMAEFAHTRKVKFPGARWEVQMITGYKNLDVLRDWMATFTMEIKKEDVLKDLPSKTMIKRYCEPSVNPTNEDYGIEGDEIALTKLQKICTYESNHSAKMNELNEILDELGDQKVLLLAEYMVTIDSISELLDKRKDSYVKFTGKENRNERAEAVYEFTEGEAQFFVGNYGVVSHGLNLANSSVCIFVAPCYSYDFMTQAAGRIYRKGTTLPVTYISLVGGKGERAVYRSLRNKGSVISEVTRIGIEKFLEEGA